MVFEIVSSIKSFISYRKVFIDNHAFRLHYKATAALLIMFSLLVTSTQYFGDPIDCIFSDGNTPSDMMDTYCWIHTTFTLPSAINKTVGQEVAHPGIEKALPNEDRVYHKYYQWVCFVLFFQAIMFYIPHMLWKKFEEGRMKSLVLDLDIPLMKPEDKEDKLKLLIQYFQFNWGYHNNYFIYYVICEVLNFVNVFLQMALIDSFLGGVFWTFGTDVLKFSEMDQEVRSDPMVAAFPRMTKCTFRRYGPSGDLQRHDGLCILPLNIVNEKIYIFLWFWFVCLSIISGLSIIYRLATILVPQLRFIALRWRAGFADVSRLRSVVDAAKIGDWFILYLLSKNIDGYHFGDLIHAFSKEIYADDSGRSFLNNNGEKDD